MLGSSIRPTLVLAVITAASCGAAAVDEMDQQRWRRDLEVFAETLPKRHAALFARVSEETFRQEVAGLETRLGELANYEVMVELMRLAALARDSHTDVTPVASRVPFRAEFFAGVPFVVATGGGHQDLLGCEIETVGGRSIDEVVSGLTPVIDRDNDAEILRKAAAFLSVPDVLVARGIGARREEVVLEVAGERCRASDATVRVGVAAEPESWVHLLDRDVPQRPLYQQRWSAGRSEDHYWSTWLPEQSTLYVQYNASSNQRGRPSFAEWSGRVLEELERRGGPALVIDLRHNTGGNFLLADRLARGLARPASRPHRLFVLTSRDTGSAATVLAARLAVEHGATVVGELSRSSPNRTYNA